MNIKIEVKIKLKTGKEITLNNDDARELYYKLHELYGYRNYIPYYPNIYDWKTYTIPCTGTFSTDSITISNEINQ
jgi:hypothetical protein